MYKLLIVDDEQIERDALRLVVERFLPEVCVIGEAENGRVAVRMAEQLQPDVITMDIKMPGMDGVEAVRIIGESQASIRTIMVSAFDTFEYARQVMRSGVRDYLLKPWKKKQILESLSRVLDEIKKEKMEQNSKAVLESKFRSALPAIEAEWVSAILMDTIQESPLTEWSDILGIRPGPCFSIVFTFSFPDRELSHQEKQQLYIWIRKKCKEKELCLVGSMSGKQIPVFVVPDSRGEGEKYSAKSKAVQFVRQIMNAFTSQFRTVRIFAGIGTNSSTFEGLVDSYHEALNASRNTETPSRMLYYGDTQVMEGNTYVYPIEMEKQLLSAIRRGNVDDAILLFDKYLKETISFANFNMDQVQHDLHKLFSVIKGMLSEIGIASIDGTFTGTLLGENNIRDNAKLQLKQVLEQVRKWYISDAGRVMQKVIEYITDHYSKDLMMEEVAEHAGLSPYHFNKLLKDQCGMTYIDYITKLRIEKAKVMILDPNRSLKEICISVGYRDPNYFSRVFKKTVGMSPSEFRIHHTDVECEASNV